MPKRERLVSQEEKYTYDAIYNKRENNDKSTQQSDDICKRENSFGGN